VVAVVVEVVELYKHFAVLLPQNLALVAVAVAVKEPHC
jgi:hypothetical protein